MFAPLLMVKPKLAWMSCTRATPTTVILGDGWTPLMKARAMFARSVTAAAKNVS